MFVFHQLWWEYSTWNLVNHMPHLSNLIIISFQRAQFGTAIKFYELLGTCGKSFIIFLWGEAYSTFQTKSSNKIRQNSYWQKCSACEGTKPAFSVNYYQGPNENAPSTWFLYFKEPALYLHSLSSGVGLSHWLFRNLCCVLWCPATQSVFLLLAPLQKRMKKDSVRGVQEQYGEIDEAVRAGVITRCPFPKPDWQTANIAQTPGPDRQITTPTSNSNWGGRVPQPSALGYVYTSKFLV